MHERRTLPSSANLLDALQLDGRRKTWDNVSIVLLGLRICLIGSHFVFGRRFGGS